ncbi:hypothetical protein AVEN_118622-1 [Araneus ventricosus]|uniref:Uncharacterized protein n=1 Tax=Araneus ventricosus TaxID=182803 RepID=A0A4Y2AYW8_ARAVE|nr:hypothetical protein AVEN_118622-1 [Araneus ventricosus]
MQVCAVTYAHSYQNDSSTASILGSTELTSIFVVLYALSVDQRNFLFCFDGLLSTDSDYRLGFLHIDIPDLTYNEPLPYCRIDRSTNYTSQQIKETCHCDAPLSS